MLRLLKIGQVFLLSVPFLLIFLKILQVNCEISGLGLMFVERVGKGLCRRIDDISFWIIVSFALSCSLIIRTYFALSPANQALCSSTLKRILFVLLAALCGSTLCLNYLPEVKSAKGTFYWEDRFEYEEHNISDSTICWKVARDCELEDSTVYWMLSKDTTFWEITKDSELKDTTVYWVLFKDTTIACSKMDRDTSDPDILENDTTYGVYIVLPRGYQCFGIIKGIQDFEGWLNLVTYLVIHLFCSLGFFLAQRVRRTQNVEGARLLITSTLIPFIVSPLVFYAIAFTSKVAMPEETLSPTGPLKAMGRIVIYPIFFFLLHIWCRISWKDRLAISFRFSPLGFGIDVQKKP